MNPNAQGWQPGQSFRPNVPAFQPTILRPGEQQPNGYPGQPQQGYYGQQQPYPGQHQGYPQQQQQQPYRDQFQQYQQFSNNQSYQQQPPQLLQRNQEAPPPASWDDEPAPAPQPSASKITLPPPSGEAKAVSLSIGGSKPAAAKSLSIGGGSGNNSAKSTPPGTPKPAQAAKLEKKEEEKKAPAAVAPTAEAKAEARAARNQAPSTADAIVAETQQAADTEALNDLYGADDVSSKLHVNIVFIGHVDAGKSTMGGNLLYLSGMVDKRTMEKYEREAKEAGRESWYLSWALDSTRQERDKGITVEVGRAYFETPSRRYTILDAPGHKNFVPSMISGAAQADVAVLVISARKGEFETGFEKGGQTREHAMLVRTAGVQRLIVVVNKMDDPTVEWSQERYKEIVDKMTPFIKTTGFSNKMVTYIPVSAYTGANLKEVVAKDKCSWHDGSTLLGLLDNLAMTDRDVHAPVAMPISEKYRDMGTIVVGKIESGRLRKGSNLVLMPNKTPVEVTAIYNEMEEEVPSALAGDNIRIRLRGVEEDEVQVGFVLTDPRKPVRAVTQFQAQLVILEHKNIICAGYGAVLHVHTMAEEVTLTALLHYFDKKTGRKSKKPPQFAKKGQKIIALIETAAPICIERFEDRQALGRFTLRDEGRTIAIGKVTKLIESGTEESADMANLSLNASSGQNAV